MAQENQNQALDKKKAEIKVLTATLYKIWVDYDELFKLKQNPDYLLKKPRYEYRELSDELLDEARRLFSDISDFVQLREAYDCLISVCFYFNTEIVKAVSGREYSIKPIAGEFLTKITREYTPLEWATILGITLQGGYIGNTTLKFLDECADILVKEGLNKLLYGQLKNFLKQGGMTQPGVEGITPFREDKRRYIELVCKKLEPQYPRTFEDMVEEDLQAV